MTMELDIIIPVYNEGPHILSVLKSFQDSVRTPHRVLLCYDHDDDNTLTALKGFKNQAAEIVCVKNKGVGAHGAVLTGFQASTAGAVLVFPADDTFNASRIDAMVKKSREGCDIVCASRFIPGGAMQGCPWLKAFLVRTAAWTLYHFGRLPARDATSGFRLFSQRLLQSVPIESSEGFTYSIELLVKCHRLGWKIGEVPALWFERRQGQSRFKVLRWLPAYLRWYFYAFATTYLGKGPSTVPVTPAGSASLRS